MVAQCIVTVAGPISVGGSPSDIAAIRVPFRRSIRWLRRDGTSQILLAKYFGARSANGHDVSRHGQPLRACNGAAAGRRWTWYEYFLLNPYNLGSDGAGGVFIADQGQHIIRRLCANGTSLRVAGNTTSGSSGDGGLAIYARLNLSAGVASDPSGGVWIADSGK